MGDLDGGLFSAQSVCEIVETVLETLHEDVSVAQRKSFKKDKKRDCNVLFLIHLSVDSKVFEKISIETSSKAACDKLEMYFGDGAKVKKGKVVIMEHYKKL